MVVLPAAAVAAAAARLKGQIVQSPLVGSVLLAGDARVDLRWKADMVQPGGSGWYRGYLHLLLRSYGALPGLAFAGPGARMLAAALAAQQVRLPITVFAAVPPDAAVEQGLAALGAQLTVVSEPLAAAARLQRSRGHLLLPGAEHPEVAAGLATAGLELGTALPIDCEVVFAPADAADAIAAGLAAAARAIEVRPVDAQGVEEPAIEVLRRAALAAHRLDIGRVGAAVLAAAQRHGGSVPVGAILME